MMKNQERAVLRILKSPEKEYNANQLCVYLGMSSMGTLKILRRMEDERILKSRKVSNIVFFNLSDSEYAEEYTSVLLKKEVEGSSFGRWVREVRKIKGAEVGIVFGSILDKGQKAGDIDVLFVVKKENFKSVKKEVVKINRLSEKLIHAVYQTEEDLVNNILKKDKVILNAVKGVVVFGERKFVKLLRNKR